MKLSWEARFHVRGSSGRHQLQRAHTRARCLKIKKQWVRWRGPPFLWTTLDASMQQSQTYRSFAL